jgi:hypothetical protein
VEKYTFSVRVLYVAYAVALYLGQMLIYYICKFILANLIAHCIVVVYFSLHLVKYPLRQKNI